MKLVRRISISFLLLLSIPGESMAADNDALYFALSNRDFSATTAQLEQIAGGREQLIGRLLELRHDSSLPAVGMRAGKLLLGYSADARVKQALAEDMASTQYLGLARAITLHLDSIEDQSLRRSLAQVAVDRAKQDPSFVPYLKSLDSSSDDEVRRIAKSVQ